MARREITKPTLRRLFALSGNECAFPGCTERLIDEHGKLIAEVCHIEAAEEGGERYNPDQSDEDRRSFENLLILCRNHHAITNNVEKYPVHQMRWIKSEHEKGFLSAPLEIDDDQAARLHEQVNRLQAIALSRLPHGAEVLVGRDEQLKWLEDAWNHPGKHVVSIVAWGGVGKTALAVEGPGTFWRPRPAGRLPLRSG